MKLSDAQRDRIIDAVYAYVDEHDHPQGTGSAGDVVDVVEEVLGDPCRLTLDRVEADLRRARRLERIICKLDIDLHPVAGGWKTGASLALTDSEAHLILEIRRGRET